MNKNAKIILVVILIISILSTGIYFVINAKNATEKIVISGVNVELPKNLKNLKDLLTDYYYTTAKINISNYSNTDFVINQLNVNAYTLENNEIFTQTEPLKNSITLLKNSNTEIEIKYKLDYTSIIKLLEDNNINIVSAGLNFAKYQSLGTKLILKGFVSAGGITIEINEKTEI